MKKIHESALTKFNLGYELDKSWAQAKTDVQKRIE